jgi:hypothetical protein
MFQWYQWSATPEWILVVRKGDSLPQVDSELTPGEWLHCTHSYARQSRFVRAAKNLPRCP